MSRRRAPSLVAAATAILLMLLLGGTASSYGPTPTATWVVSGGDRGGGVVASTVVSGSTAYLGGNFTYAGPPTGSFVAADSTSGAVASPWPAVGGNVYAAASDGANGFFIGGQFSSIGTRHADNIAHIKADGTLDTSWTGSTDGTVYALAVSSDAVYAGGAFATAGGAGRANLASFSKATGALNATFGGNATGTDAFVTALRLSGAGTTLYVGGKFTTLGSNGLARANLGAVNPTTGNSTSWSANTDGIVYSLAVSGTTVYAGGAFRNVKTSTPRDFVAAFDGTGAALPWDPAADGQVYALEVSGSTVYAGGAFISIGDAPRSGLAALSATGTGDAITAFDPDVDGQVFQIAVGDAGATVYAGGLFQEVNNGLSRDNAAAFSATTGTATGWAPVIGGEVDALGVSGTKVGLGGEFRSAGPGGADFGPVRRANLAAINLTTGLATDWNPGANDTVEVLLLSGSIIYAGGAFTIANGQPRHRLAAFRTDNGAATIWNPGVHNGEVLALTVVGQTVYAGGTFSGATSVSTPPVQRNYLAAFQANGVGNGFGDLTPWNPIPNGPVFALDSIGTTVFVGGSFTTLTPTPQDPLLVYTRNRIASIITTASTIGIPTNWNPSLNDSVFTLTHVGSTLYAGGPFTTVKGGTFARGGAAAFNPAGNGDPTSWNPQVLLEAGTPGTVYSLAASASTMYISGVFRSVGGPWTGTPAACAAPCFFSPSVAAVSLATGAPNRTWAPAADDLIASIALGPQGLVLGGKFTALGFPPPLSLPVNPVEPAATYRGGFALVRALPDAPVNVTAAAGDTTATVSFGAPPYDGGAAITGYIVTVSPGGSTVSGTGSPVIATGLTNGVAYTFTVRATTGAGTGEPSASSAAVTPRAAPGAPTGVTGVGGDGKVTVSFAPPASDGGAPITLYTVTASPGGATATGTASPIDVTGLTNDTPYTFTVTATNSVGAGPASAPSGPVIPVEGGRPHPTPPTGLRPPVPDVPVITTPRKPPPHHEP